MSPVRLLVRTVGAAVSAAALVAASTVAAPPATASATPAPASSPTEWSGPRTTAGKGVLSLKVLGLEPGGSAVIKVIGPNYKQKFVRGGSFAINGLEPGTYTIKPRTATNRQTPTDDRISAEVRAGGTTTRRVKYQINRDPGAGSLKVTNGDCGNAPGTFTWAVDRANKNPGVDNIWLSPGLKINMTANGGSCGHVEQPTSYRATFTESVDIVGNGATFVGRQQFLTAAGKWVTDTCWLYESKKGSSLLSESFGLMHVGPVGQSGAGIEVTIDGVKSTGLPFLFSLSDGAGLQVTNSRFDDTHNYLRSCSQAPIVVGKGSRLKMSDTSLSDLWMDPDSIGAAVISAAQNARVDLDRVIADGFGMRFVSNAASAVTNVVSTQIVAGGGFLNQGTLNIVNTAWETPPASSENTLMQLQQLGGRTVVEASTINIYDPTCSTLQCRSGNNPSGLTGMPFNVAAGALELRSTAVRFVEPFASLAPNPTLTLKPGASATADQYTWIQPRPGQDAAALKSALPLVRTGSPDYDPAQLLWPATVTPMESGVLIDVVPDADKANKLLSPIDGKVIDKDVFGKARVDGNGKRDIGAVQLVLAPNLIVTRTASGMARLNWSRPQDPSSGPITGYRISYRLVGSGDKFTTKNITGPDSLTTSITGLTNGERYEFSVTAVNSKSSGPPSGTVEATPYGTLGTPVVTAHPYQGGMKLTWPQPATGGRTISAYVVNYRPAGTTAWIAGPSTNVTEATINGLTNGTAYEFGVHAVTTDGTHSEVGLATGTPTDVPHPPAVTAKAGLDRVALKWTTPDSGGTPITGYQVQYRPKGSTTWLTWPFTGTGNKTVITGLKQKTDYEFRVSGVNGTGTGAPGTATATTGSKSATTTSLTVKGAGKKTTPKAGKATAVVHKVKVGPNTRVVVTHHCKVNGVRTTEHCEFTVGPRNYRVVVRPQCSEGVTVVVRVSAKENGKRRATWTRTWTVRDRPSVACTAGGNG